MAWRPGPSRGDDPAMGRNRYHALSWLIAWGWFRGGGESAVLAAALTAGCRLLPATLSRLSLDRSEWRPTTYHERRPGPPWEPPDQLHARKVHSPWSTLHPLACPAASSSVSTSRLSPQLSPGCRRAAPRAARSRSTRPLTWLPAPCEEWRPVAGHLLTHGWSRGKTATRLADWLYLGTSSCDSVVESACWAAGGRPRGQALRRLRCRYHLVQAAMAPSREPPTGARRNRAGWPGPARSRGTARRDHARRAARRSTAAGTASQCSHRG